MKLLAEFPKAPKDSMTKGTKVAPCLTEGARYLLFLMRSMREAAPNMRDEDLSKEWEHGCVMATSTK
jgi:hypothetical protein